MTRRPSCARCREPRPIHGRGLCSTCHKRSAADGTISRYDGIREDRRAAVLALINDGITDLATIAEHLGCTKNAAQLAVSRARRSGHLTPDASARGNLPPGEPACIGSEWGTFDDLIPDTPGPARDAAIATALSYCARCPIAVREWCIVTVDPRPGCWTGVAGGRVFGKAYPQGRESVA